VGQHSFAADALVAPEAEPNLVPECGQFSPTEDSTEVLVDLAGDVALEFPESSSGGEALLGAVLGGS
jgi:hypothetical protein